MTAEYDPFSAQYKKSKGLPYRLHVEAHTLFLMLGAIDGVSVLDLACGEGHYTRLIRRRGAARVIGADVSRGMIALAKAQEAQEPLGIEYIQSSAENLGTLGTFDIVTAAFLLNCAVSRQNLQAMCRTIVANLKPGGRFVTINSNFGPGVPPDISEYGLSTIGATPIQEGMGYHLTFIQGPDSFTVRNFYYSHETYEAVFREAGFRTVRWQPPEVDDEGIRIYGRAYWQRLLDARPFIGIECTK
jgi:2-polyprenyl-3-methyl-5-hydroxy-6-metoxy-1,4-benzoquinol methylase